MSPIIWSYDTVKRIGGGSEERSLAFVIFMFQVQTETLNEANILVSVQIFHSR